MDRRNRLARLHISIQQWTEKKMERWKIQKHKMANQRWHFRPSWNQT